MPAAPRRALVSVSDKTDLDRFARELIALGFEIVSTGGTRRFLEERGVAVLDVSSYTGFPEIMEGRVKTLHPKVHGAILGRPDLPDDAAAIREHGIVPFELVVCNLYPFERTIAREGVSVPEAIEQIDIGGPSMVRSAAKNHAYVGIVTSPDQYDEVLAGLRTGALGDDLRRWLAAAAFETTAHYDRAIADYMSRIATSDPAGGATDGRQECLPHVDGRQECPPHGDGRQECPPHGDGRQECLPHDEFPETLRIELRREMSLRYGENPHQRAAFHVEPHPPAGSLATARHRHGKDLSYNNLLDLDAALALVREFDAPACAVIKHTNPCGCGTAAALAEAFERAYAGDPVSAFGSIIGFNRPVDAATAERLCEPNRFVEAIIAPAFEEPAFEILTTRPKWKKNVRLLECPGMNAGGSLGLDYRRVTGGMLVQDRDDAPENESEWKPVARRAPDDAELADLRFAWTVCKHVKSNAIVLAKASAVVGVGAGQMSRLDSSFMAAHKAGERGRGSVLASDAFFPFRDGVDEAARAGVTAIVQPGGSVRDEEVIAACDEHGLAMVFTGQRHFRH